MSLMWLLLTHYFSRKCSPSCSSCFVSAFPFPRLPWDSQGSKSSCMCCPVTGRQCFGRKSSSFCFSRLELEKCKQTCSLLQPERANPQASSTTSRKRATLLKGIAETSTSTSENIRTLAECTGSDCILGSQLFVTIWRWLRHTSLESVFP